jgi:hypothetical protein
MTKEPREESDQLPEQQPGEAVPDDTDREEEDRPTGGTDRARPKGDDQDDEQATGNPDNAG